MALRINHNVAALNALRNLNKTDDELSRSLEVLSSGQKINRAADGPASLVISEQMRGQIGSVRQAIQNSEASISMVQTAEAALNEVASLLVSMRQLAIHAANEGANDDKMLAADQFEIENALETVDRIARTSQFGTRTLLDGSNGANGVAVGDGLAFVSASPLTKSSPAEGYPVDITRPATRAEKVGTRPITLEDLRPTDLNRLVKGFKIMISEGGKNIAFDLDSNEDGNVIRKLLAEMDRSPEQFNRELVELNIRQTIAENLQRKADSNSMDINVFLTRAEGADGQVLAVRHRQFGSSPTFFVGGTVPGILAVEPNRFEEAIPGRDVEGTLDGKIGVGSGELLMGAESTAVEGLSVQYDAVRLVKQRFPKFVADGPEIIPNPEIALVNESTPPQEGARLLSKEEDGEHVIFTWEAPAEVSREPDGYVHITQNSLAFQVGPTRGQQVKISLIDAKTDRLSRGLANASGFQSLKEIDVTTSKGAEDSMLLIDHAITRISELRADLGAFQKNTLQSNANSLRIAEENLVSAESSLRDADMAAEVSQFTRNQVMLASGMAMLAQANQTPQTVLQLLTNRGQ
jgi:flagellin